MQMANIKKKANRIGVVFLIAIISIMLIVTYAINKAPNLPYSRSAEITDLDICDISYSKTGTPKTVTICGFLNIEDGDFVKLSIIISRMPDKVFVSENPHDHDLFEQGFFSREINLDGTHGSYIAEIFLYRNIIGSINFDTDK